ncbi:MAG TPA: alcohol dehydrogenase [Clostridiales bacterium]|nr:alcohol dehydrogenase [Clostridiales bacterium]
MATMLAAEYRDGRIEARQLPRPRPGAGEVLLQVEAAALCATDLKIWQRGHRNIPPDAGAILGHEVVGSVVEAGEGIGQGWLGKRVVVAPNIGCGLCPACQVGRDSYCPDYRAFGVGLAGGLAEFMLVTAPAVVRGNLVEVPRELPADLAVLAEAAGCCYRGLQACSLRPGEACLVLGVGPMGILSVVLARAMGAAPVLAADPLADRRSRAREFGADQAIDPAAEDFPERVRALTGGQGADVAIVTAPVADAQRQAILAAAVGGRVNLFAGLSGPGELNHFPSNLVHYRGLQVLGTTGAGAAELRAVVSMMAAGRLEPLRRVATASYPLSRAADALEEARQGKGIKTLVIP